MTDLVLSCECVCVHVSADVFLFLFLPRISIRIIVQITQRLILHKSTTLVCPDH